MRGDYLKLLENTLLQESLNIVSNDQKLISQIITEVLHNDKLKTYILNGFGENHDPNYNKEDFITKEMGHAIALSKKASPIVVNTRNKIFQYVEQLVKNLAKHVLPKVKELYENRGGDVNEMGEINRVDPQSIIQNIGKVIQLLLLLNDEAISKTCSEFMVRPEPTGSSSILKLDPSQYVSAILNKSI